MLEHPHHFGKKKRRKKENSQERQRAIHLIDSSDLGWRIQLKDEICRWKTRWNMSEVKPKTLYETLLLTNIELCSYIATILLTLLTIHASTLFKRTLGVQ